MDNCPICKYEFFFPVEIHGLTCGAGGQHGEVGIGTGKLNIMAGVYRDIEHCGNCGFIRLKVIK